MSGWSWPSGVSIVGSGIVHVHTRGPSTLCDRLTIWERPDGGGWRPGLEPLYVVELSQGEGWERYRSDADEWWYEPADDVRLCYLCRRSAERQADQWAAIVGGP